MPSSTSRPSLSPPVSPPLSPPLSPSRSPSPQAESQPQPDGRARLSTYDAFMMLIRISCLIPIFSALVALALSIVLAIAGGSSDSGQDKYWLSLNTSRLGQHLVQLTPPASSTTSNVLLGRVRDEATGNITIVVDGGLPDIQGEILGNLTRALGVRDTYRLFLTRICQGDFAGDGTVTMTDCMPYSNSDAGLLQIAQLVPSHFIVRRSGSNADAGGINVTVPLVTALGALLDTTASLSIGASEAMFVLAVVGAAGSGLCASFSAILVLSSPRYLAAVTLGWSMLAAAALMALALTATGAVIGGATTLAGLGAALDLDVAQGHIFLELAWIAAAFAVLAAAYWFAVWFVDFRTTALVRRRRWPYEIGSWAGIWAEVLDDMRLKERKTR